MIRHVELSRHTVLKGRSTIVIDMTEKKFGHLMTNLGTSLNVNCRFDSIHEIQGSDWATMLVVSDRGQLIGVVSYKIDDSIDDHRKLSGNATSPHDEINNPSQCFQSIPLQYQWSYGP